MNKDELEYFKNLLIERKNNLEKQLADAEARIRISQINSSGDISSYRTHPSDTGSDTQSREISSFVVSSIVDRLKKINEAIEKIEDGTYGICEICGKNIEKERLKALPFTSICYGCSKKESKSLGE